MKSSALRSTVQEHLESGEDAQNPTRAEASRTRFDPQPVRPMDAGPRRDLQYLRMYTEEQVSEILQVSISQLRKWRMKRNHGQGPPFRKIGRLVRYPERGLVAYINGKHSDH